MCGCKAGSNPKRITQEFPKVNVMCQTDVSVYENLLITIKELGIKDPQFVSYVQSQINVYDKSCSMFEPIINEYKIKWNI